MKGFFSKKEVSKVKGVGAKSGPPCERCGLYKKAQTPKMEVTGEGRLGILIIGEAPEKDETTQFTGKAGQLLRDKLQQYELDLDIDFWVINAVNCQPPEKKKPTRKQIVCCKEYYVNRLIEELQPKFIWLLGGNAIESFYDKRFSQLGVTRWRGLCIPDKASGAWVVPLFHPSFLLRSKRKTKRGFVYYDKNNESVYDRDLKQAVKWFESLDPPEFIDFHKKVELVTDIKVLKKRFNNLRVKAKNKKIITAFDYETSALKPFHPINHVWCMGIAYGGKAFSFPIDYTHWDSTDWEIVVDEVSEYLLNAKILKIAHNLKFEDMWSRVQFKQPKVYGWLWCSMNAAHIIDARKSFTGLKFQAYINFGIEGYDKKAAPYMKSRPGSFINRLNELPLPDLLMYCGLDALLTRKLYFLQRGIVNKNPDLKAAYQLTHKGLLAFSDTQLRGFPVDELYYLEEDTSIGEKIELIEAGIMSSKYIKLFKKQFKREINIDSTDDLKLLFPKVMNIKLEKKTEKGNVQLTAAVLESLDVPIAKRIVRLRKLKKIKNTYMKQIIQEVNQGRIHAFINLHIPRSYRSSSSNPNLQNVPTREEEAKKSTRSGFVPELGCRLLFGDYGSQEVRIIGCYTKDTNLLAYLHDESTDMHRDQAEKIFVLDDETITKKLRGHIKTYFVFPEFYGSYYVSCARNIWRLCMDMKTGEGIPVRDHLIEEGVLSDRNDYNGFEDHLKGVEKELWETFPGVRDWQTRSIDFYQRHGYVETMFGYRRSGLLTPNMIVNTPIQATAFHCLLWAYIKLNYYAKRHLRSRPIFQIHDEIVWNLYPDEEKAVVKKMRYIMEKKIRAEHEFLIAPLTAEIEMTEVNGSWYMKKAYEEFA